MTGRLSDRPMIRAASIPHLGQTTPTAALGLRAIRSLLTRLDASAPPTVLCIPEISAAARLSPRVSENTSFLEAKSAFSPVNLKSMQDSTPAPARQPPYICGYDARGADISVALESVSFPSFEHAIRHSCPVRVRNRRDCRKFRATRPSVRRNISKNRLKTRIQSRVTVVCGLL